MNDVVATNREKVLRMEAAIASMPQIDIPVRHYWADGIYAREATIPAGVTAAGKIHKYSHLVIISKGAIAVMTPDGLREIRAPATFVAPPGTKRAAYAIEETVWTTIHGTHETDLDKLERHFIARDFAEYDAHIAMLEAK
mgnify:CR=1 FL=1